MLTPSPHYTAYIEVRQGYALFDNHARLFSDADVVSLICPRPVLIEQGRRDRVAHWPMSKRAFADVHEYFERLGISEWAVFSLFDKGHEVRGGETFEFLDRWLKED